MALRIIAGQLKGRKLTSVPGSKTRPTADRIREAIFNILAGRIRTTAVLDLFAGTGALGLEALSRGAESAVFVDFNQDAVAVLRRNVTSNGMEKQTRILRWDIVRNLNSLIPFEQRFNLVFMDPPYNKNTIVPVLTNLQHSGCLQNGAMVVIEHCLQEPVPEKCGPFRLSDQRKYRKTLVSFMNYML